MKYVFALVCPPLAILLSRKPVQALGSLVLCFLAVATWSLGVGGILAAITVMWALRVAGEAGANAEVDRFMADFRLTESPEV